MGVSAIIIRLPHTKPPLSLNDRMHWRKKASIVKALRGHVAAEASRHMAPCDRATVELHYVPRDARRRDADNLVATLKPCLDGLVDAGIVPDDTPDFLTWRVAIDHPDRTDPHLYLRVEATP